MKREILDTRSTSYNKQYLVNCIVCSTPHWITTTEYRNGKRLFCSTQCYNTYKVENDSVLSEYNHRRNDVSGLVEIEQVCLFCESSFWLSYNEFKRGNGKFCSHSCSMKFIRRNRDDYVEPGFENGKFYWNNYKQSWDYIWRNEDNEIKSMSGARFVWISTYGDLPDGMYVINSNPETLEIENFSISSHPQTREFMLKNLEKARKAPRRNLENFKRGKDHHFYRDGSGVDPYPAEFNDVLRATIRERDYNCCRICKSDIKPLHVHHIDQNKYNNDSSNLITFCAGCHTRVHHEKNPSDPVILAFQQALQ